MIPPLCVPLLERLQQHKPPDALVAMPLHPLRLRERGYNQSALLAQHLSQRTGIPMLRGACQRIRHTPTQTGLPVAARLANLRGAFSCTHAVNGLHIGIIDDVMTSGSSLEHLARTLQQAGATSVDCWVLARATRAG